MNLREAYEAVRAAKNARSKALRIRCPLGASIQWKRGPTIQCGTVLDHGYDDRLKVRNIHTGREYWITGYDVLMAEGKFGTP